MDACRFILRYSPTSPDLSVVCDEPVAVEGYCAYHAIWMFGEDDGE